MAMLLALLLAGCANAMPDGTRLKSLRELVRGYDNTLTSAEKKAVISELQKDKERQEKELSQAERASNTN
jgi:hypothetical protein